MKIVITGHTHGIGKQLYDHFTSKGHEVVGLSRSNGFDISENTDNVIEQIKGCDLFINNTFNKDTQIKLLNSTYSSVGKTIVMGSIAGDFYEQMLPSCSPYGVIKNQLETRCKELNRLENVHILYLKISMLQDAVSTDKPIQYSEIISAIDWWLTNSNVTQMDFALKLTDYTRKQIVDNLGIVL